MGRRVRVGIGIHGAELQDLEQLFVLADPILLEKDRPFAVHFDGDGENEKFVWKNVYGIFHGKDKDLEWAWNTKDFIYQFAPAELDLD